METLQASLQQLRSSLESGNFKYLSEKIAYNPMEKFADYVSTKEIVHSKIIADLLNPDGKHGLGISFLLEFLKKCGVVPIKNTSNQPQCSNYDITDVSITTEKTITNSRRIDILIEATIGGHKWFVIVENKLNDAKYQPHQLEDYRKEYDKDGNSVRVVCLHRVRLSDNCDVPADEILYADELAGMIDHSISEHPMEEIKYTLKSYSCYLRNLSKQNIIMDNAKMLLNDVIKEEDIILIKNLKDAYEQLPKACASKLDSMLSDDIKHEISNDDKNYVYIWNEEDYRKTGFWLAVGFELYEESVRFYIVDKVDNNVNPNNGFNKQQFEQSSTDGKRKWYRPKDGFRHTFTEKPNSDDFKKIIDKIYKFLDILKDIKR